MVKIWKVNILLCKVLTLHLCTLFLVQGLTVITRTRNDWILQPSGIGRSVNSFSTSLTMKEQASWKNRENVTNQHGVTHHKTLALISKSVKISVDTNFTFSLVAVGSYTSAVVPAASFSHNSLRWWLTLTHKVWEHRLKKHDTICGTSDNRHCLISCFKRDNKLWHQM